MGKRELIEPNPGDSHESGKGQGDRGDRKD